LPAASIKTDCALLRRRYHGRDQGGTTMRTRALALAAAMTLLLAPAPAPAAQKCPSDATSASIALWPKGSIRTGQSKNGTHPCGRRITCMGGVAIAKGSRSCKWL
jgi:hypothetical protein